MYVELKSFFGCIDLNGSLEMIFWDFFAAIFILFYHMSTQKIVCLSIEKGGIVLKKNDNSPPLHAG